jgi:hypothetical protein
LTHKTALLQRDLGQFNTPREWAEATVSALSAQGWSATVEELVSYVHGRITFDELVQVIRGR